MTKKEKLKHAMWKANKKNIDAELVDDRAWLVYSKAKKAYQATHKVSNETHIAYTEATHAWYACE